MKTITRRTALAVPVTLALLPISALAMPVDPVVTAFAAGPRHSKSVVRLRDNLQGTIELLVHDRPLVHCDDGFRGAGPPPQERHLPSRKVTLPGLPTWASLGLASDSLGHA